MGDFLSSRVKLSKGNQVRCSDEVQYSCFFSRLVNGPGPAKGWAASPGFRGWFFGGFRYSGANSEVYRGSGEVSGRQKTVINHRPRNVSLEKTSGY